MNITIEKCLVFSVHVIVIITIKIIIIISTIYIIGTIDIIISINGIETIAKKSKKMSLKLIFHHPFLAGRFYNNDCCRVPFL